MILLCNNQTHFQSKTNLRESTLAWDEYPEQDPSFVGKKIHLAYEDMNGHYFFNRLSISKKIHPEFSTYRNEESDDCWWIILRFDKRDSTYNYDSVAILMDNRCRVIVTDTVWIRSLHYPPLEDWHIENDEVLLPFAETWKQFNDYYDKDEIFVCKIQNKGMVGKVAYTEYWKDLSRYKYDDPIRVVTADPNQFEKPWEVIKDQLIQGNPDIELLPDVILKGFPHYYNRHKKDLGDFPRRAINTGVIIRYDESSVGPGEGKIVVAEYTPKGIRFVTDKEAFIYYETESDKTNVSDLDLFNTMKK